MAMHTRMKGFSTKHQTKVMLSDYRGRNRDLWSQAEKEHYASTKNAERMQDKQDGNMLDDYQYSQEYAKLSVKANNQMILQIEHCSDQRRAYEETMNNSSENGNIANQPQSSSCRIQSKPCFDILTPKEIQRMGLNIKGWSPNET